MKKEIHSLISNVKNVAKCVQVNAKGVKTTKRVIVIESDDWGSIRMPSRATQDSLLEIDSGVLQHPFFRYDSIARGDDLSALFETLLSIKNANGQFPIITFNTAMANPDHGKIESSGYEKYYYECFLDTLKSYSPNEDIFAYWKDGMRLKLIRPQYHCREHLNVQRWMKTVRELKRTNSLMREAFDRKMISLPGMQTPQNQNVYMDSFNFDNEEECEGLEHIFEKGARMFESVFGYRLQSFIASCHIWGDHLEEIMKQNDIKYLQGKMYQMKPIVGKEGTSELERIKHYIGETNRSGQVYLIRNVDFEPSWSDTYDWVDRALNGIEIAFMMGRPAIISSHRLNFIGAIYENNRKKNLLMLRELLSRVVRKWPDVEFMSSDQLGNYIDELRNEDE